MQKVSRQAGAQIEVTNEMVRAGVAAFYEERHDLNVSPSCLTDIFEKALRAALREVVFRDRTHSTQSRQS